MDEQQAEMFGMVAPAFAPLVREYLAHNMQRRRLEERKELEMEMIETKAEARSGGIVRTGDGSSEPDTGADSETDAVDAAISAAEELERSIDQFKRESWCEACQQAAEALKNQPVPRARKGLQELREMEQMVERGADVDEVADRMEQFEVITDALADI